ncbi:MAG TPA: hypothetical protein VNE18_01560, partial [Rhodanobacter sp.]|nr:hypothetical protein [Rhodanobacter sp.]
HNIHGGVMARAQQPRMSAEMRKYRAQEAIRTLTAAEAVKADRHLMADVKREATEMQRQLSKVARPAKS